MTVVLTYHFDDIPALCGENDERGTISVDYNYIVYVDLTDLESFLISEVGEYTFHKTWSEEKKQGFLSAVGRIYAADLLCSDDLIQNDNFMAWLKETYEDDAYEMCKEDYYE